MLGAAAAAAGFPDEIIVETFIGFFFREGSQ